MTEDTDDTRSPETHVEGASPRSRKRPAELSRGTLVGRYVALDRIGAGGMGVVYAAYDPELNRRVALKLVSSGDQARMLREAQALARLSHPNVVAIYDVGTIDTRVFVAMELVEGVTLSAWLEPPRTWREIVGVFAAAGRGLAAAHAAGIVHRDFKPANVLVGKDGRVRVLDFGLARAAGEQPEPADALTASHDALGSDLTQTGSLLGTPVYMPPEAHRGEIVGEPGDQFSFCVALYEALYRKRPFQKIAGDALPAVPAAPAGSKVPAWLRRIVVRGLAFEPSARFSGMPAVVTALESDPAARRRRALVGVGAVLVVGSALAFGLRAHDAPRTDDPCALDAPLAGVWDDLAKARVGLAFAATRAPATDAQFVRTAAALDDTAGSWLAERATACADTRTRHSQPEAKLLLRLACLDRQRDDLDALVGLFEHADADTVAGAARAAHGLPRPTVCANARSLLSGEQAPPAIRQRVAELRHGVSEARALLLAAKQAAAGERLASLVPAARQLGYKPLLAEAVYLLGRYERNDLARAARDFDEAEVTAMACGDDAIAARAAAYRLTRSALLDANEDAVRRDAERAQAWVERTGDSEAEFDLELGLAAVATRHGQQEDAVTHYQRAYQVGSQVFGEVNARVFNVPGNLGLSLIQLGRFDEAVSVIGKSIRAYEAAYGEHATNLATALDNYGLALAMIGRYREARDALEHAAKVVADPVVRGSIECDLARVVLGEGDADHAIALAAHGVAIIREAGVSGFNLAVNSDPLPAAESAAGRHADALAHSRECLREFQAVSNVGLDTVPCRAIEGTALVDLGRASEAVPGLEQALELQTGHPAAPGVLASIQFQLARALVASGGDRERARSLADTARGELARYAYKKRELDQLDAWLALTTCHSSPGGGLLHDSRSGRSRDIPHADRACTLPASGQ